MPTSPKTQAHERLTCDPAVCDRPATEGGRCIACGGYRKAKPTQTTPGRMNWRTSNGAFTIKIVDESGRFIADTLEPDFARLIAAAPQMREVCEEYIAAFEADRDGASIYPSDWERLYRMASAALRAANGES